MQSRQVDQASRTPSSAFRKTFLAGSALFVALALCVATDQAVAWGADGHRLVADAAQNLLTPSAMAEVDRLLALEPGATMASVSTWADEVRSRSTATWHYVNLPRDSCDYDAARDCKPPGCVVSAIQDQTAILAGPGDDLARLAALKWLVHLVPDVQQPLHAGFADDRGGNLWQIQAFGRGTNLHALWDRALLINRPGGIGQLQTEVQAQAGSVARPLAGGPADWAMESCRAVASQGFYPYTRAVDQEYAQTHDALLRSRLVAAAQRLAGVLNRALSTK